MEKTENQIYKLALQYCRGTDEPVPERVLYGLIKVSSLSEMALGFAMKSAGVEDTEEIRKKIEEIKPIIETWQLDAGLILQGIEQVIPLVHKTDRDTGSFTEIADSYDASTPVEVIIGDVLASIDKDELKAFSVGNDMNDVREYTDSLKKTASRTNVFEKKQDLPEEDMTTDEEAAEESDVPDIGVDMDQFPDELRAYLERLEKITPYFAKEGKQDYLWKQTLIVSIDDGFGFSSFAKKIERIYRDNELTGEGVYGIFTRELKVFFPKEGNFPLSPDQIEPERFGKLIEEIGDITDRKKIHGILAIDISAEIGNINDPLFRDIIRIIQQNCEPVQVLFRVPYLERNVLSRIEESISDMLASELITVRPVSIDRMVEYMKTHITKHGFTLADGCDEVLEQAIITEKNDGRFYGFRTLNGIVDTAIYKKLIDNATDNDEAKEITSEQLKEYVRCDITEADSQKMLKNMVGVEGILSQIDKAIHQVKVSQDLADKNGSVERPCIHMLFRGNPGTGKTTIARIVAAKMKEAGILKKGRIFEIKGRDLCGRYVGETTPKTGRICRDAYGSVLFIDEAYELYRGGDSLHDYGSEALAALVAEMENHRDDLCVIFAGYTDEMNTMVEGNPGLQSRIPIIIDFPNYTREQLEEIFFKMMDGRFEYESEVKDCAHEFFSSLGSDLFESKEFSNARFVRNLFESVWGEAALRYDLGKEGKIIIKKSDFTTAAQKADLKTLGEKKKNTIGFEG